VLKIFNKIKTLIITSVLLFPLIVAAFPEESIYNLKIELNDKNGRYLDISKLAGKVHIFSMIYVNCKTICPIIIANMKELEKKLTKEQLENIQFTLVTLDPERDNCVSLNRFFFEKKFNEKHWNLYRTTKENTLKLALATGIKYKRDRTEFIHSNMIGVIDRSGVIRIFHQGLDKNFDDIIKMINFLI